MKRAAYIKRFPLLASALFFAGAAFLSPAGASAQSTSDYGLPQGFTFWNEISSGLVEALGRSYNKDRLDYINRQNYNAEFAGIKEKVGIRFDSENLGFLLEPELSLTDADQHWSVYYHE